MVDKVRSGAVVDDAAGVRTGGAGVGSWDGGGRVGRLDGRQWPRAAGRGLGRAARMAQLSPGGGASLVLLEGKVLPGSEALG